MHPITESPEPQDRQRYNAFMSDGTRPRAGWLEILAAPEGSKAEVIGGELFLMNRPLAPHSVAQSSLMVDVGASYGRGPDRGGPGGWWILFEVDIRFGANDIVSPDLAGWRRERLPEIPRTRPIDLAPDWVCEILSPSTAGRDRGSKADLYLRGGVRHYWLVDPSARLLEGLEAREGGWMRLGAWGAGEVARVPPFEGVEVRLDDLFPSLPSTPEGTAEEASGAGNPEPSPTAAPEPAGAPPSAPPSDP